MSSFTKTLIVDKDSGPINTNHDFETNTIWAKDANWTIDTTAKTATCTYSTGGADLKYDANLGFIDNEIYALQYTVDAPTSGTFQLTSDGGVDTLPFGNVTLNTTQGTHEVLLKCENSSHRLNLRWISDANSIILSDVSLKKHCENIQTAVTYLNSTGGSIIVEEGNYTITEAIIVGHDDISIIGRGAVIISSENDISAFSIEDKERVEISGLEIVMEATSYSNTVIRARGRNCRFEDLKISATNSSQYGGSIGIEVYPTLNVTKNNIVTNCLIEGCETGIRSHAVAQNIFQSCVIRQNTNNEMQYGIHICNSGTLKDGYNIVSGCIIDGRDKTVGSGTAIYIQDSNYNILTGNIITNWQNTGIDVSHSEGTVVSGNVCHNNNGDGIQLRGGLDNLTKYTAITGNTLTENGDSTSSPYENDITVKSYAEYNSIVGNALYQGAHNEIWCEGTSDNQVIVGNVTAQLYGTELGKGTIRTAGRHNIAAHNK